MSTSETINFIVQALYLSLALSMPTIVVASVVGTLFSLFQALTQIQEQTLSFAIKLVAVGLTLYLTASWMGTEMYNFTLAVFTDFPRLVR
jgi:type III secretion protein S